MPSEPADGYQSTVPLGDDLEFDLRFHRLYRAGTVLKLQRIPLEALAALVEQRGQIVNRDQLVERIWGKGVFLDADNSLNIAIRKLRQALNDDPEQPRFIETVTGKGYRLIAPGIQTAGNHKLAPPEHPQILNPAIQGTTSRRRLALLGTAVALVVASSWLYWSRAGGRAQPMQRRSMLAVLPFQSLAEDGKQDYFSDGLTEEMITEMGRLDPKHLGVIARTSVMYYKEHPQPLKSVGHDLGVNYVLEGSVRRDHDEARIAVRLVQVADGATLWADSFDRPIGDVLTLQSEIAHRIAHELQIQVLGGPVHQPAESEAVEAYLHGRFEMNRSPYEIGDAARAYFERAIKLDPTFVPAYAGLADFYSVRAARDDEGSERAWREAERYATQAQSLDPERAEVHTAIARIKLMHDWDWAAAREHALRALQLNPSSPEAHVVYAQYLRVAGNIAEDLNQRKQAVAVDPNRADLKEQLIFENHFARDYQAIVTAKRSVLASDPNDLSAHIDLCINLGRLGLFDEAVSECEKAVVFEGHPEWTHKYRQEYRQHGYEAARLFLAGKELAEVLKRPQPDLWNLANAYVAAGMREETMRTLLQGLQTHEPGLLQIRVDPDFDPIRDDPRYAELIRQIGFPNE